MRKQRTLLCTLAATAAAAGLHAFPASARAGAVTDWSATAVVSASAYSAIHDSTVGCSQTETYSGWSFLADSLRCEAEIGYGYGGVSLQLETLVSEHSVYTNVGIGGGGQGFLNDIGGASGRFDQVAQLALTGPGTVHLTGLLEAEDGSLSSVEIRTGGSVVASWLAEYSFEPVSLDEYVDLGAGDHEIALSVVCIPHSAGPGGQTAGGAAASFFAQVVPTVSVEVLDWGRIKSLYR